MSTWFHPHGSSADHPWQVWLPPGRELTYAGIAVRQVQSGEHLPLTPDGTERLLVPLSGAFRASVDGKDYDLHRDGTLWQAAPDVLYLPHHQAAEVQAQTSGQLLIASAPADQTFPVQYRSAEQVLVEVRGHPPARRRVRDLGGEHVLDAQRLLVCEVLTPPGGWSSYPPHKHDEPRAGRESVLEEIYYFGIEPQGVPASRDRAVGYHRTFASDDRPIDVLAEVRSGDVALVPYGWHGPCMAPPGYSMWYLNVMAGPGAQRTWQVTFHPDLEWTR